MNPFELTAKPLESLIMNWRQMTPVPYDKRSTATSCPGTTATTSFGGRWRCFAAWNSSSRS